jgi:ABC-2 type transport system ATP-binding protein
MQFEGDSSFLQHPAIAEYKDYAGHVEIKLKPHADAQGLLREAVQKATIYKFELVEPSLEEIFIQTVGEKVDA